VGVGAVDIGREDGAGEGREGKGGEETNILEPSKPQTPRLLFIPYLLVSSCISDSGRSPGLLQALLRIYPFPFLPIEVLFSLILLVPVHPLFKTLVPSLVRFHFVIPLLTVTIASTGRRCFSFAFLGVGWWLSPARRGFAFATAAACGIIRRWPAGLRRLRGFPPALFEQVV
jgi:hypothetical protein